MESRLTTLTPLQLCERWKIDEAKARVSELRGAERTLAEGFFLRFTDPERAKDKLSKAASRLEGEWRDKANVWLACAYWATGEPEEAKATIECVEPETDDVRFLWGYTRSVIEDRHHKKSLSYLTAVEHLMDRIDNPLWKGNFYLQRGFLYRRLKQRDKAILENEAAMYWYEQNDDPARVAEVKNNLAGLYKDAKEFDTAHQYVNEAIKVLQGVTKAQAYDRKAEIYLDERRYQEAEDFALRSISLLEGSGRDKLLTDSLVTLAQSVAGLGKFTESSTLLDRASSIAEHLNNRELLISVLKGRIKAAVIVEYVCRQESVRIAIESTKSTRLAADKLNISHAAVLEFVAKHKLK